MRHPNTTSYRGARPRVLGVAPGVLSPMTDFISPAATIRAPKRILAPD